MSLKNKVLPERKVCVKTLHTTYRGICQFCYQKVSLKESGLFNANPEEKKSVFNTVLIHKKCRKIGYSYYPKYIERIDDGEIFARNKNGTYSLLFMIKEYPKSLKSEYSYDVLMNVHKGFFKHVTDEKTNSRIISLSSL